MTSFRTLGRLCALAVAAALSWAAMASTGRAASVVQDAIITQTHPDYVYWEAEWFDRITNNNADPTTLPAVVGTFPSAASGGELLRIFAQANNNNPNNNQIAYRFKFDSPSPANYTFYAFRLAADADSMFVPQDFDVDAAVGGGGQANTTSGRWNGLTAGAWNTLGISSVGDSPAPGYFATGQRNYEVTAADVADGDVEFRIGTREAARYDRFVLHKTPNLSAAQLDALTLSQLTIVNDIVPPPPPSSPALLSIGLRGMTGSWGIREVRHNGTVSGVQGAINSLTSNDANPLSGVRMEAFAPVINFNDPQSPGGGGNFGNGSKVPFLSNDVLPDGTVGGAADDNGIALIAHAVVHVGVEDDYTFGFRGDDGSRLKIVGANFTNVVGGGAGDSFVTPFDTIQFLGDTGDSNTMGVTHLMPGNYDMEFIYNENGGGAFVEVFAARGAKTAFDPTTFLLVGAPARPDIHSKIKLRGPATVVNVNGGLRGASPEFPDNPGDDGVRTNILNGLNGGTAFIREDVTAISVGDPQSGARQFAFPNDTPADDNNFQTGVFGEFEVLPGNGGDYVFHLEADDGLEMRVVGANFSAVTDFTGDGTAALRAIEGDMACSADFYTGDVNTNCLISLAEGSYGFEAFQYEGGGGAHLRIWYTMSSNVNEGFNPATWQLLDDRSLIPGVEQFLTLVPEPSNWALVGIALAALAFLRRRRVA